MNYTKAAACSEHYVPISIKEIKIESDLGFIIKNNQQYHNIVVQNLDDIKYIKGKSEGNYIRKNPIIRVNIENIENYNSWPEHPHNDLGQIKGAIAIIKSLDNKILLIRNKRLWGLPKGARNFLEFNRVKRLTDMHYINTGCVLQHSNITLLKDETETSEDNLCREVMEETGIVVDKDKLKLLHLNTSYDAYYYEYAKSSADHIYDIELHGTDHENDELLWVSPDDLEFLISVHQYKRVLNHITYLILCIHNIYGTKRQE